MSDFWLYLQLGLEHVLDWNAYDHILFLVALVTSYSFFNWKKVLWLVTTFTIGHTLALFLSVYKILTIESVWIEALIPITILCTALYDLLNAKKKPKSEAPILLYIFTGFFGIIHGLGFSTYFKMIASSTTYKFVPLLEFALGIEVAQIVVVLSVLILSFIFQRIFNVNRRDWILVVSAIVIGIILPILRDNVSALLQS